MNYMRFRTLYRIGLFLFLLIGFVSFSATADADSVNAYELMKYNFESEGNQQIIQYDQNYIRIFEELVSRGEASKIQIKTKNDPGTIIRVYIDSGNNFNEAEAISTRVDNDGNWVVYVPVEKVLHLRIDPEISYNKSIFMISFELWTDGIYERIVSNDFLKYFRVMNDVSCVIDNDLLIIERTGPDPYISNNYSLLSNLKKRLIKLIKRILPILILIISILFIFIIFRKFLLKSGSFVLQKNKQVMFSFRNGLKSIPGWIFSIQAVPYYFIGFLFIIFYGHTPFIGNEDINTVYFMEIDAGSIVQTIQALFNKPIYRQFNGYHGRYYGWAYYDINFYVLGVIRIVTKYIFKSVNINEIAIIRFNHFIISLIFLFSIYKLSVKFLTRKRYALFVPVLLILSPISSVFLYKLHPEIMAQIMVVFALFAYYYYNENPKKYLYIYVAVIFLTLAALSKQQFILYFGFVGLLFLIKYFYSIYKHELEKPSFINIAKHLCLSVLLVVGITFIIHPYMFLDFNQFINIQKGLFISTAGEGHGGVASKFNMYLNYYKRDPIILGNIIIFLLTPMIYTFRKKLKPASLIFISPAFCLFALLVVAIGQTNFFSVNYTYPVYPLMIFNFVYGIGMILSVIKKPFKNILYLIFLIAILVMGINWGIYTATGLIERSFYSKKTNFLIREYIIDNAEIFLFKHDGILSSRKILFDPNIAMPSSIVLNEEIIKLNATTPWRVNFESYEPDIIIMDESYIYVDHAAIKKWMEENGLYYIDEEKANISYKALSDLKDYKYLHIKKNINQLKNAFNVLINNEAKIGNTISIYSKY